MKTYSFFSAVERDGKQVELICVMEWGDLADWTPGIDLTPEEVDRIEQEGRECFAGA
jgi:hypothetical protein